MVVLRFPAVGAGGAIATFTWLITEGLVGLNSLERCADGAATASAKFPAES